MSRVSAVVLAAIVCLAVALGVGRSGDAAGGTVDPASVVLSLADVPRGYRVGDDSGCGPVIPSGESSFPWLNPLFRQTRPVACTTELRRVWHDASIGPAAIWTSAFVVADEDAAQRLYAVRLDLARMTANVRAAKSTPIELGDDAVLLEGRRGVNTPAAVIVWRSGNVVAVVSTEPADPGRTRSLAEAQQALIDQPPTRQAPTKEAELPLDDPSIRLPVYWLGSTFAPGGGLPRLTLSSSYHLTPEDGPGSSVSIGYSPDSRSVDGIKFHLWEPAKWKRFSKTRLGRLVWDTPCATKTTLELANGHAEVFAGYATGEILTKPCPKTPPDRMAAHVFLPGVVVAVNMPHCFMCMQPTRRAHPYNTPAGMKAVVRALELRAP